MQIYGMYVVIIGLILVNFGSAHFRPIHQMNQAIFILDGTQNIRSPKYAVTPRDGSKYEDYTDYEQRMDENEEMQDEEPADYIDMSESRLFGFRRRHRRKHRHRHIHNPFHKFKKRLRRRIRHYLPGRVFKKIIKALIIPGSLAGILTGTLVSSVVGVGVGTIAGGLAGAGAGALGGIVVPGRDLPNLKRSASRFLLRSADTNEHNNNLTNDPIYYELSERDLSDMVMVKSKAKKRRKMDKRRKFKESYLDDYYDS